MEPGGAGRPRRGRGRRRGGKGRGRALLGLAAALTAALGLARPAGAPPPPPPPPPNLPAQARPSHSGPRCSTGACLSGRGPSEAGMAGKCPQPRPRPPHPQSAHLHAPAGRPRFVRLPRPAGRRDKPNERAVLTHWMASRGWGV